MNPLPDDHPLKCLDYLVDPGDTYVDADIFVICLVLDQTIGFWCEDGWDVKPKDALLFGSFTGAVCHATDRGYVVSGKDDGGPDNPWVMRVVDVSAFRACPETW